MKITIFALIFIVLAVLPINGQEKTTKPNSNQNHTKNVIKPAPPPEPRIVINEEITDTQRDRASDHPASYLYRLFGPENIPSIGLLVAGFIGIGLALKTLNATKTAADAAKKSVEIIINKERGRIQIEPSSITLKDSSDEYEPSIREMAYRIKCNGTTQITIVDSRVFAEISRGENPDHPGNYGPMFIPGVINPADGVIERTVYLQNDEDTLAVLLDEGIEDGKLHVNFWGLVRYRDIFFEGEGAWVYKFWYRWARGYPGTSGQWITSEEGNTEIKEQPSPK